MTITWELFWSAALLPYHISVITILVFIVFETIGSYLGYRPSGIIRSFFPKWLRQAKVFKVQFSRFIVLCFFLINFSFAGYLFQLSRYALSHEFFSSWVIIPALLLAWFFTLFMIHCLDQVMLPRQKPIHVKLVGRLATITSGHARPGFSAQASVRDYAGRLHYIQVESEYGELELQSQVILINYVDHHYIAKKITKQSNDHDDQL